MEYPQAFKKNHSDKQAVSLSYLLYFCCMTDHSSYFEANRNAWNQRTGVHKGSAFYDLEGFKKGNTVLNRIELEELGDVKGKSLLHLQCHFGMDTMNWERLGAICTGVDLSDDAIALAKATAAELGLSTIFINCNVYDLKNYCGKKFDIVFTSYGTIGWLPDLEKWADIVSYFLKSGGVFYIADFHPALWMMDEQFEHIKYPYFNAAVIAEENSGTYTDRDAPIKTKEYSWNHPMSDILNNLISKGLEIEFLHEFGYSPYKCFNKLEQGEDGMWRITGMDEKLPMMYSIRAVKK
jgi:ubiquinone/menaquinone biosynthesis C-methylase UbiE